MTPEPVPLDEMAQAIGLFTGMLKVVNASTGNPT